MKHDIVFVHLLNDFSGSPKVLKGTIKVVTENVSHAKLYIGNTDDGFLSQCNIQINRYWYKRKTNRISTLISYLFSQIVLFFKLLFDPCIGKDTVIFVNTLLPFGAALFAKLTGKKIIFHIHEISITPLPLKYMLTTIARNTSSLNLYVSDAHMQALPIAGVPALRIYNALEEDFIKRASVSVYAHRHNGCFNVLMVAYLRDYKGVCELINLAADVLIHKDIHFDLVVNDEKSAIDRYFSKRMIPSNLSVHPRTTDTAKFYNTSSLVLNLSRVDLCVETFGMTILEAMAYGIPVIVPPVGGPAELVAHGEQGFHVDSRNRTLLSDCVLQLSLNLPLCVKMSQASRERSLAFLPDVFSKNITTAIDQVRNSNK